MPCASTFAHKAWSDLHNTHEKTIRVMFEQVINHPNINCIRSANLFYLYWYREDKKYPQIANSTNQEELERKRNNKRTALHKMLETLNSINRN